jgi:proteasome beta subunit
MSTVVAIETTGGVAIASDTSVTDDGVVTSENIRRLFEFDSIVAGAVGPPDGIQTFGRRLEAELRTQKLERSSGIGLEKLGRIAVRESERAGVDAVVAARDTDGIARIREVGADGHVLSSTTVALGSGAALALGQLETLDLDVDIYEAADAARAVLRAVSERDPETGGETDVRTVANDGSDGAHDG